MAKTLDILFIYEFMYKNQDDIRFIKDNKTL